jgi:DNA-directed RNA polymerase subunit E"
MKKRACKNCKILTEANECPICKSTDLVINWKGRVAVLDAKKSFIAKKAGFKTEGEFAIKVR